ncbi:MAG: penicillin-binding transpeptidase domain-containing protein [Candidatus Paceibacterota bacterium]
MSFDIHDIIPELSKSSEKTYVEHPIGEKVFLSMLLVCLLVVLSVFGRVFFLNVLERKAFTARAEGNANKEIAIPAFRGLITDRYGEILAKNAETFSVFINLSEALKKEGRVDEILSEVSKLLGLEKSKLRQKIDKANLNISSVVALQRNISTEQAIQLKGLAIEEVLVLNDYRREYIDGPVFSHVIGYTGAAEEGNDIVGKTGLEKEYEKFLAGEEGVSIQYKDAHGNTIEQFLAKSPVSGKTLQTTIDAGLQRYFHQRLEEGLQVLERDSGVGIALNPQTGEVLSLISFPDYDNNVFVTPERSSEITEYFTDQRRPLFNRAVSGEYNPASTIKILMGLAALHEGVADDVFGVESKGYIEIPNPYYPENPSRFVDWKAHGWVNIRSALARSSNIYFYVVGGGFQDIVGLGINNINKYWKFFKFDQKTGIDLAFEEDGFLPNPEEKEARTGQPWRIGDTYNVSIGQGDLSVTPIQLLRFVASVAAKGLMYKPYIADSVTNTHDEVIYKATPEKVLDYSDWTFELTEVRAGMEHAVTKDYGAAHLLGNLEVEAAGKTGSAQISNNTKTNAFFVGYAPRENPEIAILILVENAREGSSNTIPIARDVLDWYYKNRIKETFTE